MKHRQHSLLFWLAVFAITACGAARSATTCEDDGQRHLCCDQWKLEILSSTNKRYGLLIDNTYRALIKDRDSNIPIYKNLCSSGNKISCGVTFGSPDCETPASHASQSPTSKTSPPTDIRIPPPQTGSSIGGIDGKTSSPQQGRPCRPGEIPSVSIFLPNNQGRSWCYDR